MDDVVRFEANCPHCATPLDNVQIERELWELGGLGVGPHIVCPGCKQQISTRIQKDRLVLKMLTLPVGAQQPPEVEAHVVSEE